MYTATVVFTSLNVKIISSALTAKFQLTRNSKIFHNLGQDFYCPAHVWVDGHGRVLGCTRKRPLYKCPKKIDYEPDGNVFKRNPLDRNGGAEKKISCRARDRKRSNWCKRISCRVWTIPFLVKILIYSESTQPWLLADMLQNKIVFERCYF